MSPPRKYPPGDSTGWLLEAARFGVALVLSAAIVHLLR